MKLTSSQLLQVGLSSLAAVAVGLYSDRAFALGFMGAYDSSNFTLTNSTSGNGSVDTTNALAGTILLVGGDNSTGGTIGNPDTTDWTIPINNFSTGNITFNWSYASFDSAGNDPATFILIRSLVDIGGTIGNNDGDNGFISTFVQNGDVFGFRVRTVDNSGEAGELTISNFSFQPVPFEFSPVLGLVSLGALGIFNAIRKSAKIKK